METVKHIFQRLQQAAMYAVRSIIKVVRWWMGKLSGSKSNAATAAWIAGGLMTICVLCLCPTLLLVSRLPANVQATRTTVVSDTEPQGEEDTAVSVRGGTELDVNAAVSTETVPATPAAPAILTAIPTDTPLPTNTYTPLPKPTATSTRRPTSTPQPQVMVGSSSANVREGPGTAYGVVGVLAQGDMAVILGKTEDGSWYNVQLPDGTRAWIAASVVEPVNFLSTDSIGQAATIPAAPAAQSTNTPQPVAQVTSTTAPTVQPTNTVAPAQPTAPPPTEAPPTEPPSTAPGDVVISYIYYDGQVYRVESDEYAVVTNRGGSPVNIGGWRLNAGAPGQDFSFPSFDLQPGQSCRVYTNESHPDTCGFSFGRGQAIWNNDGDCGYLFDAGGAEVSRYCY